MLMNIEKKNPSEMLYNTYFRNKNNSKPNITDDFRNLVSYLLDLLKEKRINEKMFSDILVLATSTMFENYIDSIINSSFNKYLNNITS
jgi:hypothetical protein